MKKSKKYLKISLISVFILLVFFITFIMMNQREEVINKIVGNIGKKAISAYTDSNGIGYSILDPNKKYAKVESCNSTEKVILIANEVTINNETYTVTRIDDGAFKDCKNLEAINIPDEITYIGNNVFQGCSGLTRVGMSQNVSNIGESAFEDCTSLIELSNLDQEIEAHKLNTIGAKAFKNCSSLELMVIPDGVAEIKDETFLGCTNLRAISAPVTKIGNQAFKDCSKLADIYVSDKLQTIGESAFENCTSLKGLTDVNTNSALNTIGARAFKNCTSIELMLIPEDVSEIKDETFLGCTNLRAISAHVTKIGNSAFEGCSNLVNLGETTAGKITQIGNNAFKECKSLDKISVSEDIEIIGESAFENCELFDGFTGVGTNGYLKSIGKNAFKNCKRLHTLIEISGPITKIETGTFEGCSSLPSIDFADPNNIEEIGENAFKGCVLLNDVELPNSVRVIRKGAFSGDTTLEQIYIANGNLEIIEEEAFKGCTNLGEVVIDSGNKPRIGNSVFEGCIKLSDITLPENLMTIGENAFKGCTSLEEINIPKNIETIAKGTFLGNTNLQTVTLSDNVQKIEDEAFKGCIALDSITFDGFITLIGNSAFEGCTGLQTVEFVLPTNLQYINDYAFKNCISLQEIEIPDSVIMGKGVFEGCTLLKMATIGDGVEELKENVFAGCNALELIIVPKDIRIDPTALPNNTGLMVAYRDENGIVYVIDKEEGTVTVIKKPEGTENIPDKVEIDGKEYGVVSSQGPMIQVLLSNQDNWTKEDIMLTITVMDPVEIKSLKVNEKLLTLDNGKAQIKITSNGAYKIVATNKDNKTTTKEITISKIDKVVPKIENVSKNEIYAKEVRPILIDNESGIDTVKLIKDEKEISYTIGSKIQGKGKYKLEVKDKAGNVATVEFEIVVGIKELEGIKIEDISKGEEDPIIKITVDNEEIGKITINGQELKKEDNDGNSDEYIYKPDGKGDYEITIYDKDGNVIGKDTLEEFVDKEPSRIDGVKDNETYEKPVTPDIKIEDSKIDKIVLIKDGKEVEGYKKGDEIKEDGNYTLIVYDKDGKKEIVTFEIKSKGSDPSKKPDGDEGNPNNSGGTSKTKTNTTGKDTTTAKASSLPKAGMSIVIIVVIVIGMFTSVFLYVKNKQYKDVK